MTKQAVFTMKLEPDLRTKFMAAAEANHRPASQVMRELMREFVQRQHQAEAYDTFVHRKVEHARADIRTGQFRSNDEIEAKFSARRAEILKKA